MLRKICGESTLQNVILVTNMWKEESMTVDESREKELREKFLKPAIDKGAKMFRHDNTNTSAYNILRRVMKNHPVVLQIQRELVDEHKDIVDTDAGATINREIRDLIEKREKEFKDIRDEMQQALREKDDEARRGLGGVRRDLERKMARAREASEGLAANYAVEREKVIVGIKEMEKRALQEREQDIADHDRELAALVERLKSTPDASVDDRARWEQEIMALRDRVTVPIYE